MSRFLHGIKVLRPLSRVGKAIATDLQRNFASITRYLDDSDLVSYREIGRKLTKDQIREICDIFSDSPIEFSIKANQVFRAAKNDIILGKKSSFCSIKIFSGDGAELNYGDYGIMPSEQKRKPLELMKKKTDYSRKVSWSSCNKTAYPIFFSSE